MDGMVVSGKFVRRTCPFWKMVDDARGAREASLHRYARSFILNSAEWQATGNVQLGSNGTKRSHCSRHIYAAKTKTELGKSIVGEY
jgi:hypothetical protein